MNIKTDLLQGDLVHLTAEDPKTWGPLFSRWRRDSEYARLLDSDPASLVSAKKIEGWIEKEQSEEAPSGFFFGIRTNADDRLIGFVGLGGITWTHEDCWVGIGIGERDYWGRGYGTDAMRLALRFTFTELNLHRVTLGVFGYNQRAIRSYEKAGFRLEGVARQEMLREGRRWDTHYMAILRKEWEGMNER